MLSTFYWFFSSEVAQLVEQWTENPCVGGSIPSLTTNAKRQPEAQWPGCVKIRNEGFSSMAQAGKLGPAGARASGSALKNAF